MKKKDKKWDLAPIRPYKKERGLWEIALDLANGKREPANDFERELLKDIRDMEAKGIMMDLPFE